MDTTVFRALMPPPTGDRVRDALLFAEFFDNSAVDVGISLRQETLTRDAHHHRYRYETGAVWLERYEPMFNREAVSFPINTPDDAMQFTMPDAASPERLDDEELRRVVAAFHDAGYFVQGGVMGAWFGVYYYLTTFANALMWMASHPDAAHALFDRTSRFSLDSATRLLRCGVDCIFPASDLGSARGLLFSRAMFQEYVLPWLRELADCCHDHGAFLHLHSHGHIEEIMDDVVDAGVDIINPIGPSDNNDLAMFKAHWGDRVTLHGGISTTIGAMSREGIRGHIADVMAVGRVGGRFFPRTESGIPPMTTDLALFYIETLKEARHWGYA